jgi:HlyD family secretion protein
VPSSALFRSGEEWSVFVVNDGKAELRAVTIDHRSDAAVEVTGGLAEGDEVVVFPSDKVVAGVAVKPR